MKKFLLLVAVAMTAVFQMSAQDMSVAFGGTIEKVSEDGRYAVFTQEGTLYLLDTKTTDETKQVTVFAADDETGLHYSIGFGHIFADDNTLVGQTTDNTPAILKNGEWTLLPVKESDLTLGKINSADAITPDGSRICGGIAMAEFSMNAKEPMLVPVIWDKQADGTYGQYTVLPYPKTDFTGSVPQYVTARDMSADGKTIIGQITDNIGFSTYPIVYRQDAEGKWSYELILEEMVYNTQAEFLKYPTYEPQMPNAEDYMDEAGLAAFDAANQAYMDSLMAAYETGEWPSYYPNSADFLTGENKAAYDALNSKYQEENAAYLDSLFAFQDFYAENTTGASFEYNISYLSSDGKYAAMTYIKPGEIPFWDPDQNFVCRYNIETKTLELCEQEGSATGIMDNGNVLYSMPYDGSMWQRTAHVMNVGATAGAPLESYIATQSAKASELFTEVLTCEMLAFDTETWEPLEEPDTVLVLAGTTSCNRNGSILCGWTYNEGNVNADWSILGYIIDLTSFDDYTSIKTLAANNKITSMVVTDLNGAVVNTTGSIKDLNKGTYLITTKTADGQTKTIKVCKK